MFGEVVLNIPHHAFEFELKSSKEKAGVKEDSELQPHDLLQLVETYKKVYTDFGHYFPQDPIEQLYASISAVFLSWGSERAIKYRDAEGIVGLLGTAVNVQAMVFGNMDETSGTAFASLATRTLEKNYCMENT